MTALTAAAGLAGAAPVPGEPETAGPIPWEDPGVPRLRALLLTLLELLGRPRAFFRRPAGNGWQEALAFGLSVGTAGLLAMLFWGGLLYVGVQRGAAGYWPVPEVYALGPGLMLFLMVVSPAVSLFNLAFSAVCLWGAAALSGAPRDFNRAWRIYCYAQGGLAAGVIPLLGAPLAGLWVLFLVYTGVQTVYGISGWRSLGVLFLFLFLPAFLLLLVVGTLLAFLAFLGFLLFLG